MEVFVHGGGRMVPGSAEFIPAASLRWRAPILCVVQAA